MRINHNISALNTYRQLSMNNANGSKSIEKLSSGLRINRAGDDAAGLAISEKMRGQIRGLDMASKNAQDGISLIQTAEGALNETHSILQRMRELAVQAANDTNTTDDRAEIQKEIDQLKSEIDRIADTTEFNTKKLLNGGAGLQTEFSSETVAGVSQNWLDVVGGTADTKATNVDINITAAENAKSAVYNVTVTGVTAGAQTISINGYTISYTATTTAADNAAAIAEAINAVSDKIGVTAEADGADLSIMSSDVGSAASITINAAADTLTAGSAVATTVAGEDASITGITGDYIAQGNSIIFTTGDYKGMEIQLNAAVMSDTAGDNQATFKVTGNGTISLQIGANEGQDMSVSIGDMRGESLGISNINVTTAVSAKASITTLDAAIKKVSGERAKLGAYQNRLEHTINNLGTSSENLSAAESRIRDVDMAKEMMEFTKNSILTQAAQAMLAQANQQPQGVLQLLR
jgi:flagellin